MNKSHCNRIESVHGLIGEKMVGSSLWMLHGRCPSNNNGDRIVCSKTSGEYELIHTHPELDVLAKNMEGNDSAFYYSPITVGATGNIFIISSTTVYVAKLR
jgi:hypothetical protein